MQERDSVRPWAGIRVSMDIGGTFTDVVAYDEQTGTYAAGKASTTPHDLTEGVFAALAQVVEDVARDRVLRPRHDRRAERLPPAARRASAAARDRGGRRHVPDRPRQPDEAVRAPVPQADPARPAAGHRRDPRAGSTGKARSSSRSTRKPSARPRGAPATRASARSRSAFSSRYLNPAHELRAEEILREELGDVADLALPPSRGRVARVRAHLDRPSSTPTRARSSAPTSSASSADSPSAASKRRCT